MTALLSALLTASLVAAAGDVPASSSSRGLDPSTVAMVDQLVVRAAEQDPRVDARVYEGGLPRRACFADPACITKLADQAGTRLVLFGELGVKGGLTFFSLDAFDVRTGHYAGRETAQTETGQALAEQARTMVTAVLDRLLEGRSPGGKLRLLVVELLPPKRSSAARGPPEVPWLLFGSGVVAGGAALFFTGAGLLYAIAIERDLRAGAATWQVDAYRYVQERNTYALSAVMVAMLGAGLLVLSSMGAVYWLLGEE